ncbi:MAG TPA: CpaF/VirB11 family protein, partial [Polyangiales bacterium]
TSMLNALSGFIPEGERVVVIEDSREVQFQKPHVVQLEARPPDPKGKGAVSIRDLFRATLRMRPDRVVVGEIRGGEALELVQAMTSGHGGCMSTVHATYPTDTLSRLETMALMSSVVLPLQALRAQISSAIDIIVQTSRMRDGSRCVTHISEVLGLDSNGAYRIADIFLRGEAASGAGMSLLPTGYIPAAGETVRAMGMDLPASIYRAASARRDRT